MEFNDLCGSRDAKIEEKSLKHRIKFEAQDEVPLGIDFGGFWSILGGMLGGKTNPNGTKIEFGEPKSIVTSAENHCFSLRLTGCTEVML